jgi:hypothetical protein
MQKYYNHACYGICYLGNRLNYIKVSNAKIYNYYNKKGEFAMQCQQDDKIDNESYFSMKKVNNNQLISELEKKIIDFKKNKALSQDIVFNCSKCHKTVCTLQLFFYWNDEYRPIFQIQAKGFIGEISAGYLGQEKVSIENFARIKKNLNNLSELNKLDHDLFGFICRECDKAYCNKCWNITKISYDEGFYEDTQAICPYGHKQVIDD